MEWPAVLARQQPGVLEVGLRCHPEGRFLFAFDEAATDRESLGDGKCLRIVTRNDMFNARNYLDPPGAPLAYKKNNGTGREWLTKMPVGDQLARD